MILFGPNKTNIPKQEYITQICGLGSENLPRIDSFRKVYVKLLEFWQ